MKERLIFRMQDALPLGGYTNRSEFIRDAIVDKMRALGMDVPDELASMIQVEEDVEIAKMDGPSAAKYREIKRVGAVQKSSKTPTKSEVHSVHSAPNSLPLPTPDQLSEQTKREFKREMERNDPETRARRRAFGPGDPDFDRMMEQMPAALEMALGEKPDREQRQSAGGRTTGKTSGKKATPPPGGGPPAAHRSGGGERAPKKRAA